MPPVIFGLTPVPNFYIMEQLPTTAVMPLMSNTKRKEKKKMLRTYQP